MHNTLRTACTATMVCLGGLTTLGAPGQSSGNAPVHSAIKTSASEPSRGAEARAARAYDETMRQGPLAVYAFLHPFPKGADLHVHLGGAVYAETFIRDAAEDGLCIVGSSRVDLQACKLEYSIVSPK